MLKNANFLLKFLSNTREFEKIVDDYHKKDSIDVCGCNLSFSALLISAVQKALKKPALIIAPNEDESITLHSYFNFFTNERNFFFPEYDSFDVNSDIINERVRTLEAISNNRASTVITTLSALVSRVVDIENFKRLFVKLKKDDFIADNFFEKLVFAGYERRESVVYPGDFATRGGTFDIFPLHNQYPLRVELFGNRIDAINFFDPMTHEKTGELDKIDLTPLRDQAIKDETSSSLFEYCKDYILFIYEPIKIFQRVETSANKEFSNLLESKKAINIHFLNDKNIMSGAVNFDCKEPRISQIFEREVKNEEIIIIFAKNSKHANDIVGKMKKASFYLDLSLIQPKIGYSYVTIEGPNFSFGCKKINLTIFSFSNLQTDSKKAVSKTDKRRPKIESVFDIKIGDVVVHKNHGIARFVGIERLSLNKTEKDYLELRFKDEDVLYLPIDQLNLLYKYVGSEKVSLNKLGGSEWSKTQQKVKNSCQEIAEDLIKLYAERENIKGIKFGPDSDLQRSFEESFPYEETIDQLRSIDEIKQDMQSEKPMERLLCGDAGYGKTEVAMRASFKAIVEGYQVAYLAPTTILANQQYDAYKNRMEEFGVKVEVLSRFKTAKEQAAVLKDVKNGIVDVVIGTHRLLQKDVKFYKLGFLVVDEEQRFGVMHKERIKEMCKSVDTLMLSATPIPRTLYLSMSGIRDISVLKNPPKERRPVRTYVLEYDEEIIISAISKEIERNGQIYYINNRIDTIYHAADKLKILLPKANISIIHGQMEETEIENTILNFLSGNINVLVCTSIIEIGIDIPNANTIIIENADKMGLSQLYQLRGRVGRSNKIAYAYLTFKKDKVVSEIALERLKIIKEFTNFGSGLKIAMRDLEIRGAGSVVGTKQHGHLQMVGYEMYLQLLNDAVKALKGEKNDIPLNVTVDIPVDAYIPKDYIKDDNQRIENYKKIAIIENEHEFLELMKELNEIFGAVPKSVVNLAKIALIKCLASKIAVTDIMVKNGVALFRFSRQNPIKIVDPSILLKEYAENVKFVDSGEPHLKFTLNSGVNLEYLSEIEVFLRRLN